MAKTQLRRVAVILIASFLAVFAMAGPTAIVELGVSPQYLLLFVISGVVLTVLSVAVIAIQRENERQKRRRGRVNRRRRRVRQKSEQRHIEFDVRLANFLQRPAGESAESDKPYRSKMPFWCRTDVLSRFAGKSREQIRELLERIHRAVRGRQNGHG
ncbi:MAG: hypothetical protein KDA63_00495 [Planctomycetales bacterium]|nr:hypothetical protein [Planctomycetales bacterium]